MSDEILNLFDWADTKSNPPPHENQPEYEIMLGDFLLNAGVVGLIKAFQYAESFGDGCKEGADYRIQGQSLFIRQDYFKEHDVAALFIQALVHYLGDNTKFTRVMAEKTMLDTLYHDIKLEDKAWKKAVDEHIKSFVEMLLKNSFQSGFVILSQTDPTLPLPSKAMLNALKKETDYAKKKELYDRIYAMIDVKRVRDILQFKDILYSVITMFYADNKGNGAAFLSKREIDPADAFREKFVTPLLEEIEIPEKKKKDVCIVCGSSTKFSSPISLFIDTTDDLGKKKSYYWNCQPDAYYCPLCALVCAFAPLGFHFLSSDAVFINNNADIPTLLAFDAALKEQSEEDVKNSWYQIYNTFTSVKLDSLVQKSNHIQVIYRERNLDHYHFNTVSRHTIQILQNCHTQLSRIKKISVKVQDKEYLNVYRETVENILMQRSQYPLTTQLLSLSMKNGGQTWYLAQILTIQIAQKGGNDMTSHMKKAYVAKKQGETLRQQLTGDLTTAEDRDNKIRGTVYQMLNAVSLGNRDRFMEQVIRLYSGIGQPVPDIFFTCFSGEEEFKEIGFAYLLGLKSEGYQTKGEKEQ